jgi:hypothetical protein
VVYYDTSKSVETARAITILGSPPSLSPLEFLRWLRRRRRDAGAWRVPLPAPVRVDPGPPRPDLRCCARWCHARVWLHRARQVTGGGSGQLPRPDLAAPGSYLRVRRQGVRGRTLGDIHGDGGGFQLNGHVGVLLRRIWLFCSSI